MDSTLLAAIIGAAATVVAVVLAWYLQRPKKVGSVAEERTKTEEDAPIAYARRYLEYPSHYRFIKSLPKLQAVVQENAQEGWDTGGTPDMREASYDVIDFLQFAGFDLRSSTQTIIGVQLQRKSTFALTSRIASHFIGPSMNLAGRALAAPSSAY